MTQAHTEANPATAGGETSPNEKMPDALNHDAVITLKRVIELEKTEIGIRRKLIYKEEIASEPKLTGISLSGGGIRSACFNLGLLEGLDQLAYENPKNSKPPETNGTATESKLKLGRNHLELFDYVSSVSGGSYAAGHLATAMLPKSERKQEVDRNWFGRIFMGMPPKSEDEDDGPQWFGKISLTSKTVPNWLWVVGVWFLGAAFQLLKTGALLVGLLAMIAFVFHTLDAPDAMRFCDVLGLGNDVARGFIPFWITLGFFLVLSWFNKFNRRIWSYLWIGLAVGIVVIYVVANFVVLADQIWYRPGPERSFVLPSWVTHVFSRSDPEGPLVLPSWFHLVCLLALALPAPLAGVVIFAKRLIRTLSWGAVSKSVTATQPRLKLRTVLLGPMLVAFFCFAGLVTTGDIQLPKTDQGAVSSEPSPEETKRLAAAQDWIYRIAVGTLGITSLAFFFPKNLLQSARRVEEIAGRKRTPDAHWFDSRVRSPIFSVIVFLSSYGFILILVFVLYGFVAKENISGYYEWREDLPSAAWHPTEFKEPVKAWEQIDRDASRSDSEPAGQLKWRYLARKLMKVRQKLGTDESKFPLDEEWRLDAKARALASMPWIVRLFGPYMCFDSDRQWTLDHYSIEWSGVPLYDLTTRQQRNQTELALRIARDVLGDSKLWKTLPPLPLSDTKAYRDRWEKYLKRARVLETLNSKIPAIQAAIRANNRLAVQLYLPDFTQDRINKKVVFATIVWGEDQWARLWIVSIAGLLWLVCCAVDVNTFSLQRFYRGHVIDSWVKHPRDDETRRWLHQTGPTYRSRKHEKPWRSDSSVSKRRAPLLLINATRGGNRSRGDEPDPRNHIFTFSPVASGYGPKKHWPNGDPHHPSFASQSNLDIGNIVATSGAFLAPGNEANPAMSIIFHLLNIQTGYWARRPKKFSERTVGESLLFHLAQSVGLDRDDDSRFLLSDGAHVENLGLYVLLQRKCSLIVASDCSQQERKQEADQRFDALAQVLRQARVDGIEIGPFLNSRAFRHWLVTKEIVTDRDSKRDCRQARSTGLNLLRPADPEKTVADPKKTVADEKKTATDPPSLPHESKSEAQSPAGRDAAEEGADFSREHYLFAQIKYPGGSRGLLVYLRPTLTGDEGDALMHGAARSEFPDDDPVDQFYAPSKMKTYRLLGRHIAEELMQDPLMKQVWEQITQGHDATADPKAGEAKEKEKCYIGCDLKRFACDLNRPRGFRPIWPPAAKPQ